MYLGNYKLWKMGLEKYLKSPAWGDPSTSTMVNGPKYYWNLDDSTFIIFINHCECNLSGKSLS